MYTYHTFESLDYDHELRDYTNLQLFQSLCPEVHTLFWKSSSYSLLDQEQKIMRDKYKKFQSIPFFIHLQGHRLYTPIVYKVPYKILYLFCNFLQILKMIYPLDKIVVEQHPNSHSRNQKTDFHISS